MTVVDRVGPARRSVAMPALQLLLAAVVGTAGGTLFYVDRLPLPWLLGSVMASTLAAVLRLPIAVPRPVWVAANVVLALLLGSRMAPEYLAGVVRWVESLVGLGLSLAASTAIVYAYLRRIGGYPPVTAFFGATPGGIVEMTQIGAELGGDERTLALLHACRLLLTVSLMPVVLYLFAGIDLSDAGRVMSTDGFPAPFDLAVMVMSGISGTLAARQLGLPGAFLLGPIVVYGTATALGVTSAAPPNALAAVCQVLVGAGLGSRFRGVAYGVLWRTMRIALGSTLIHLNFSLMFAVIVNLASGFGAGGLGIGGLILAYAPGGQVEMSLLAMSMGTDAPFITIHTIIRGFVVPVLAPIVFRALVLVGTVGSRHR